jgi:formimidoylglutamate deiminase
MPALFANHALLPNGWAKDVRLTWSAAGVLNEVMPNARCEPNIERAAGPVLPGMPNVHSHAFQRAMAGLTEHRIPGENTFWGWRRLMYAFAQQLEPEELEAIATQLYIEMLKCGYTSVCEFQYIHHDPHGRPYANPAELSERLIAAASKAGIGLTLLPVLYEYSGFGSRPPRPEQRRFVASPEALLQMLSDLRRAHPEHGQLRYGMAPHSLRAVSPESLQRLVAGLRALDDRAPIHMHIAEQTAEVEDSRAILGTRPVAWLLDHIAVDARWCLVHATHMTAEESARLARSGATVGLCPTTEANLGDGIFDASTYFSAAGAWGIGSDSHVSVSVQEELRWLEYTQRLLHRQRNVLAEPRMPNVAEHLYLHAVSGGAGASARNITGLAIGQRADLLVLDPDVPDALADDPAATLSAWIFGNHPAPGARDTMVGGRWVVKEAKHAAQGAAQREYVRARAALLGRSTGSSWHPEATSLSPRGRGRG